MSVGLGVVWTVGCVGLERKGVANLADVEVLGSVRDGADARLRSGVEELARDGVEALAGNGVGVEARAEVLVINVVEVGAMDGAEAWGRNYVRVADVVLGLAAAEAVGLVLDGAAGGSADGCSESLVRDEDWEEGGVGG